MCNTVVSHLCENLLRKQQYAPEQEKTSPVLISDPEKIKQPLQDDEGVSSMKKRMLCCF